MGTATILLVDDRGRYRSLLPLKALWLSVIMFPVDWTFLAWLVDEEPPPLEALRRVLAGVDLELSFLAVFGTFLPLES